MRTIEEIQGTLKMYRNMKRDAEQNMNEALKDHSEFAYNVHHNSLIKSQHYIEMLEYVLGERE